MCVCVCVCVCARVEKKQEINLTVRKCTERIKQFLQMMDH